MKTKTEETQLEETKMTEQKSKKELSKEEKKAARRAAIQEHDGLHIDDKYKEEGYSYRIVNDLPGNIESWKTKGYEIVTHDMKIGNGSLEHPGLDGTAVQLEVGRNAGSMKAVIMRTTNENKEILDEIRDDLAREQAEMVNKVPGIPNENLIGSITKENLK